MSNAHRKNNSDARTITATRRNILIALGRKPDASTSHVYTVSLRKPIIAADYIARTFPIARRRFNWSRTYFGPEPTAVSIDKYRLTYTGRLKPVIPHRLSVIERAAIAFQTPLRNRRRTRPNAVIDGSGESRRPATANEKRTRQKERGVERTRRGLRSVTWRRRRGRG